METSKGLEGLMGRMVWDGMRFLEFLILIFDTLEKGKLLECLREVDLGAEFL